MADDTPFLHFAVYWFISLLFHRRARPRTQFQIWSVHWRNEAKNAGCRLSFVRCNALFPSDAVCGSQQCSNQIRDVTPACARSASSYDPKRESASWRLSKSPESKASGPTQITATIAKRGAWHAGRTLQSVVARQMSHAMLAAYLLMHVDHAKVAAHDSHKQ